MNIKTLQNSGVRIHQYKITLEPGEAIKGHQHTNATETIFVLAGNGVLRKKDEKGIYAESIQPDSYHIIYPEVPHEIITDNTNPLILLITRDVVADDFSHFHEF